MAVSPNIVRTTTPKAITGVASQTPQSAYAFTSNVSESSFALELVLAGALLLMHEVAIGSQMVEGYRLLREQTLSEVEMAFPAQAEVVLRGD